MADSVKIKITGDDSEFKKTLNGLGNTAGSVFKGIMGSQIVTKGVTALASGLKDCITTGMDFEAQMSNVAALSGATGEELALLTQTAKDYGASTKFSASQAAEALSYMALAGWDANQSVSALGGVLNLAAASGMELGAASDMVTDYLSAFGMECEQAEYMADLMAYAQSKSNTSAQALGDAYGNCAASMHAAGQDIETTTAMLMALANQGIKGSEAGTQMSAVMRDLTSKMKDGQIMIGKTAVQVVDAQGNFRDLNDIMVDVGKATEGMGTAEASAALMTTFTARSVKAVQTLLNEGMDNVNAYEEALRGSEGTALEQSQIMLDNLQGDLTIFQSALEGVKITASESFNGIARQIVQEGTGILEAINNAGKTGGISGMADAVIAQIPTLLPKLTTGVQNLLQGLGKKMPSLMKGLISALPSMLTSLAELAPSLTDSLFEMLGAAVEGLIEQLPALVPTLIKGVGNMLLSVGKGIGTLVDSLFSGIGNALMDIGLIGPDLNHAIETQIAGINKDNVAIIKTAIQTEDPTFDKEAYAQQLQAAVDEISSAIDSIEGLSDADRAKLKNDIMSGSGAQAVIDAMTAINIPEGTATAAATALQSAVESISSVVSSLGLTEAQQGEIKTLVISGASADEIQATLESYNVDPSKASEAANNLSTSFTTLDTTLQGLGLDESTISTLEANCADAQGSIIAALTLLGAPQETIDAVIASYDGVAGTLAGKVSGLLTEVYQKLTDGVAGNDEEAINAAREGIAAEYDRAIAEVEAIRQQKITELESSGLTGTALEQAVQEVNEECDGIIEQMNSLKEASEGWLDANADATTEQVRENYSELQAICDLAAQANAEIESARAKLTTTDIAMMNAVKTGDITNTVTQAKALGTAERLKENGIAAAAATRAAEEEAATAELQAANEAYQQAVIEGADTSAAEAAIQAATERLNAAGTAYDESVASINATYDQNMTELLKGMMKAADPEAFAQIEGIQDQIDVTEMATGLQQSVMDAIAEASTNGEPVDTAAFFEGLQFSDADWTAMAEQMGIEGGAAELQRIITESLKSQTVEGGFNMMETLGFNPLDMMNSLNNELAQAISSADFSAALEPYQAAIESGLVSATDSVNWTDASAAMQTATQAIGQNAVAGLAEGMAETGASDAAGNAMGASAVENVASGAGCASPSTITHQTGVHVAQGLAEGIKEGSSTAAAAAAALGAAAVAAVRMDEGNGIGAQFAAGIAAGISSGRSQVISAAIELAKAAVNATKSALQIHSPSKVAYELGMFYGEGFQGGAEKSIDHAVNSIRNSLSPVNLTPKMDFSGMQTTFGTGIQDLIDAENTREYAMYINGHKFGVFTAPFNSNALNQYADSINIGYGKG